MIEQRPRNGPQSSETGQTRPMARVGITGASGRIGGMVAAAAQSDGWRVERMGRSAGAERRFELERAGEADLWGLDALVHCAISPPPAVPPGRSRVRPDWFVRLNAGGTRALFLAARRAGVRRVVFLSSAAVYDAYPPGTVLHEALEPRPTSLFGAVKREGEDALLGLSGPDFAGTVLRSARVYGASVSGDRDDWQALFAAFRRGEGIAPHAEPVVHGADLADAVVRVLSAATDEVAGRKFNVADMMLDRRVLLEEVAALTRWTGQPPHRIPEESLRVLPGDALRRLGWNPGGMDLLRRRLPELLT